MHAFVLSGKIVTALTHMSYAQTANGPKQTVFLFFSAVASSTHEKEGWC